MVPNRIGLLAAAIGLLAGCSTPKTETPPPQQAAKPVEYFHVDSATAATVHGKILFRGAKPARQAIAMDAEASCAKAHAGKPVYEDSVLTSKDGALANAFVYIQAGLEGKTFEPAQTAVALDQHGCMFVPRVIGIRAGQTLAVKNSDPVSHNIHPVAKENREWSQQQSPESPDLERKFARPEVMIPVKCDVHKWMRSFVGVMAHPYFAVTGPDGSFMLPNLPPGDYTVAVWHEKLGDRTQTVHVAPSANVVVSFSYE